MNKIVLKGYDLETGKSIVIPLDVLMAPINSVKSSVDNITSSINLGGISIIYNDTIIQGNLNVTKGITANNILISGIETKSYVPIPQLTQYTDTGSTFTTTFQGAAYNILSPLYLGNLTYRHSGGGVSGTSVWKIFQTNTGEALGNVITNPIPEKGSVIFGSTTGTSTRTAKFSSPLFLQKGIAYILVAANTTVGNYQAWNNTSISLLTTTVPTNDYPLVFTTNIPFTTGSITFNPLQIGSGGNTIPVTSSISPLIRLNA